MSSIRSMGEWPTARCGITGSSRLRHPDVVRWMLAFWERHGPVVWVLGGARGVDTQAEELCLERGWPYVLLRAFWKRAGVFFSEAGQERNAEMVAWVLEGAQRAFLAFPCPRSIGTWGCRALAKKAGIEVFRNSRLTPKREARS